MSFYSRFSCLSAPFELPGLTSNCQNIEASIDLSFNIQRFSVSDPNTCNSNSPAYRVGSVIDLQVQSPKATASSASFPDSAQLPSATAASYSYDASSATADSASSSLPPAVLAVFQLQLDLSGLAGTAWMDTLSGSGSTSDVQVLGHDVGLLVALTGSTCDATEISNNVNLLSDSINIIGGVVRSWSCLPGPTYTGLLASEVSGLFSHFIKLSAIHSSPTSVLCADDKLSHLTLPPLLSFHGVHHQARPQPRCHFWSFLYASPPRPRRIGLSPLSPLLSLSLPASLLMPSLTSGPTSKSGFLARYP